MIQSIYTISNTLGKKTVAESIESKEVLNMLKDMGVDCGQGFYLGRPGSLPENVDNKP
jgi:EAL domain-containing protein (putative c-di-GMP-specific phosphodiesterase class I)